MAPTLTKKEANYRIPIKTNEPCRDCSMYRNGSCTLVKGDINPAGTCEHFDHK